MTDTPPFGFGPPSVCVPQDSVPPAGRWRGTLSLRYKVALTPTLILLMMGLMLAVAGRMGERNTAALRALDQNVFEPLNQAQSIKGGITLVHTRLFALLATNANEVNQAAQKTKAAILLGQLEAEETRLADFLGSTAMVSPAQGRQLRDEFASYAALVRETAGFAIYDPSYGELVVGGAENAFHHLRTDLDALVLALAQRRTELTEEAVSDSLAARQLLFAIGAGAIILALLGSILVGRSIAGPILRLIGAMNRLARGDTNILVPETGRSEEVGAMARAVEVFRANAVARRRSEAVLQRTNMLFDAALNSMLQGMVVWGPDRRVQLVNGRYFTICGLPDGCIQVGMSMAEVAQIAIRHGLHAGEEQEALCRRMSTLLTAGRSMQIEMTLRRGLIVRLAGEPMADGGTVITFEDITDKRETERQIVFMARHDALTKLPNRALFREHLHAVMTDPEADNGFAILCLDLDHFKQVNDKLGHAAGDQLLQQVADRLRAGVRAGDLAARLGGDEFAIVLCGPNAGTVEAVQVAQRLVGSIAAPYELHGQPVVIGTSIGIVTSERGVPLDELLKRADIALYRAKEERNTFALFEPGMAAVLHHRRELEADLRVAVHGGDFELHYQPVYSLLEDRVTSFEALIRWHHPVRGNVGPNEFIPIAEQTGLIDRIGAWVLRTACAQAMSWPDDVKVAVNLSPVQFRDPGLAAAIQETLEAIGFPAGRLILEITETAMLQDTDSVIAMLRSLHDLGIKIAMDDFGTGYSSLNYLRRFPFDKIKIDRSFIADLRALPGDAADVQGIADTSAANAATILRTMIGLGQHLGISTVAEGVETAQQFAHIHAEGCSEVQGYFISPARPAAKIPALLQQLNTTMPTIAAGRGALPRRIA